MNRSILPLVGVMLAACSSSTPTTTPPQDAAIDAQTADTVTMEDSSVVDVPVTQDVPAADVPTSPSCGTEQPTVSGITATEGLVIGPDGTIYYSQSGGVGRLRPGAGMAPEPRWARVTGATSVWGLALDPVRQRLYVGAESARKIYSVDLSTDPPTSSEFLASAGQPNGLTLGSGGVLWYTDFSGGHVYRVTPEGMRTRVTTSTISGADGIAFGPDGALYVTSYGAGTVVRLELTDNMETARTVVATNARGADGLNFDAMGRMYVGGNGQVLRYDSDGSNRTVVMGGLAGAIANVEFGVGALSCTDLYVASGAAMVRLTVDSRGADVPWHHAP